MFIRTGQKCSIPAFEVTVVSKVTRHRRATYNSLLSMVLAVTQE